MSSIVLSAVDSTALAVAATIATRRIISGAGGIAGSRTRNHDLQNRTNGLLRGGHLVTRRFIRLVRGGIHQRSAAGRPVAEDAIDSSLERMAAAWIGHATATSRGAEPNMGRTRKGRRERARAKKRRRTGVWRSGWGAGTASVKMGAKKLGRLFNVDFPK